MQCVKIYMHCIVFCSVPVVSQELLALADVRAADVQDMRHSPGPIHHLDRFDVGLLRGQLHARPSL
jgi:hypothetical protein